MNNESIIILDLRDSPWVDGPGRTILDCAESLEGKGFHFIIGSFSGGLQKTSEYADEARRRGLKLAVIDETSAFDWRVLRQINELVSKYNIDIIHCHDFRSNLFGLVCARVKGIPVITTVHGWIANDIKGRLYTFIDKILLRYFSHIIAVSNKTGYLVKKSLISEKKITVINNALKIENYNTEDENISFREELGFRKDEILIGNIGRLSPEKGQFEFLRACKNIVFKHENIKLILVGVGPDKDKLSEYVISNKLSDSVYFVGYRKDMVNIYKSLDLVIQSSSTEGMPNVMLEALIMNVPVIATNVGGTSEIIENNKTGVLINYGRTIEIENKVKEFLSNIDKFKKMAKKGRTKIINEFSHDSRIKNLSRIYINSIKGKY